MGLASEFLKTQIEQLRKELDAKQQQLLAYGREKDIISADPGTNASLQNLDALNRDYGSRRRGSGRQGGPVPRDADRAAGGDRRHALQRAGHQSARGTLAKLERDYAEKLNLYKPEWPAMQQLKTQIDKSREHLDALIQETVTKARDLARNDYETAVRREANLKAVLVPQRTEVQASNTNAVEYNNLRLEVEAKRQQLDAPR